MSAHHHHHEQRVPRPVLYAAGAMMLTSIAFAAVAKQARDAESAAGTPPAIVAVELRFEDREDGSVAVIDAASGDQLTALEPGTDGFARGVLRGMYRTRRLESIGAAAPFRLAREADGRLTLTDPESGRVVELRSFGRTNYEAFARLLEPSEAT